MANRSPTAALYSDPPSGNGRPARPAGPSARPAAVVFAVILVVFLVGFVADVVSSNHHPSRPTSTGAPAPVPGTGGLVPEPATAVLASVISAGQPPADLLSALVVPKGTVAVPGSGAQHGVGLYDATVAVAVPATEQAALTFFRTELAAGKWHVISAASIGAGQYRLIAQHPASDGNLWELGVTMSPTAFHPLVAGMTVPRTGVTPVTLRLFATSGES